MMFKAAWIAATGLGIGRKFLLVLMLINAMFSFVLGEFTQGVLWLLLANSFFFYEWQDVLYRELQETADSLVKSNDILIDLNYSLLAKLADKDH